MFCVQPILANAANAAASILTSLWIVALVIMGSGSSYVQASESAIGGRTPLHADHELLSLIDEIQPDPEIGSSPTRKEPVAIDLLRMHRQSVASIQLQHSEARASYARRTSMQRLLGLIPYTAERILTFFKLMQLYIVIASLESQLMMSDRHQHHEPTTTTLQTVDIRSDSA